MHLLYAGILIQYGDVTDYIQGWFDTMKPWLNLKLAQEERKVSGEKTRKNALYDDQVNQSERAGEFKTDDKDREARLKLLEDSKKSWKTSFASPALLREAARAQQQIEESHSLDFLRE